MAELVIYWTGESGKKYKYWIFEIGHPFKAVPGNYIFTRETAPHVHKPIYIGQTDDLSQRFDDHHKMPCIRHYGATYIHAHESSTNKTKRVAEETDLIEQWHPVCND